MTGTPIYSFPMTSDPTGAARHVDRAILTATLGFSAVALVCLFLMAGASLGNPSGGPSSSPAPIIYGVSLLLCSLFSFLYNMYETTTRARQFLRYCDHCAIFLLIAGTYTPFVINGVPGPFEVDLLTWVWALALTGIVLKILLLGRHDRIFVGLYLLLGWLLLVAIDPFVAQNPLPSLILLAIGGVAYTVGAIIFGRGIGNWTGPVWHGCVLTGSGTHFVAVLLLVA